MTPDADTQPQAEPTMEEILASIRKIIATDKPEEAAPTAAEDIIELTDVVAEEPVAAAPPEPPPPPPPPPVKEVVVSALEPAPLSPPPPAVVPAPVEAIVSEEAADASASVFANLTQHLQQERQSLPDNLLIGNGQQTVEGLMIAILKPMVKEWLDQNLPATVERMVAREIERIARFHRD